MPAERFTSHPPYARRSSARTVRPDRPAVIECPLGRLPVGVVVIIFVSIYWFMELGFPLGLTQPRLGAEGSELAAQQVLAVERGYNIYQANCARCHGEQGEGGGIGPALNRQDKLFAHLSEAYLKTVLTVGGRYVCGNPASVMPVWADTNGGPLNYRQIEELIAFLRAPSDQTFIKRDEHLLDPRVDPVTGEVETFVGWRDPDYKPEPAPRPSRIAGRTSSPPAAAMAHPRRRPIRTRRSWRSSANTLLFTETEFTAPADVAFTLTFDNQDAGVPHDVVINDSAGTQVFKTDTFPGAESRSFTVGPLAAGAYPFLCSVHPTTMTGTLTVE